MKFKCQKAFKKIRITNKKRPQKINSRNSALINIRNKLLKDAERKAKSCQDSRKQFCTTSDAKVPQENHRNKTKFVCEKCDKKFELQSGHRKHVRVHKEPKEIKSTICEKKFKKQSNFEDHEKIHVSNYNDIEEVEKEIADLEAEENRNIIIKNFKKLSENPENVNLNPISQGVSISLPPRGGGI